MVSANPAFPFFVSTEARPLSQVERSVVERLLSGQDARYQMQASDLSVVGRCGCGECPTVFFQQHVKGEDERDLVSYVGQDENGGMVATAVLIEKDGLLC